MKQKLDLADVAREPFILYPPQGTAHAAHTLQSFASAGTSPRIVQTVEAMHTALGLVAAGIGVTLAPSSIENTHRESIEYRRLTDPVPVLELTMGHCSDDTSTTLPHFIEIVRSIKGNWTLD